MREETKETFNTVADIENELRHLAKIVMGTIIQPLAVVFSSLAANLHDVWMREKAEVEAQRHKGNAAAMREELERVCEWLKRMNKERLAAFAESQITPSYAVNRQAKTIIEDNDYYIGQLEAALSTPPRNCDVYDRESCRMAYHMNGYGIMTMQAFADWLFSTAESEASNG